MKISSAVLLLSLGLAQQQVGAFTSPLTTKSSSSLGAATMDPAFSPPDTSTIDEIACKETAARMKRVLVPISEEVSSTGSVGVSYVHWPATAGKASSLPIVMVHGFDSSALEYRRLGSKLAARGIDVYAVDLLGWGYSQLEGVSSFSANAKVEALKSFTETVLGPGQPFAVAGASLGGAAVIELASANPEVCKGLVLIDAQGFVDGIGPMASMPTPIASLGVQVLKSVPLRSSANQMSYFDKETFATDDAVRVGRLHCLQPGWSEALVSFMQSGGFSPSAKVPTIEAPSLILWGRQDGILDGKEFANKFVDLLPDARLQWIEECGHVPHLEQPEQTADAIAEFLSTVAPGGGAGGMLTQGLAIAGATVVVAGAAVSLM
jgi:pimeloyl-ACP methyl ester carboxylesterase